MTESHNQRSGRSLDEQVAFVLGGTLSRTCKCGRSFTPTYPEQLRCPACRRLMLYQDGRRPAPETAMDDLLRAEHDWQLVDPDHPDVLVWASDLAKLYREQTRPRPIRNNLRKWL